MLSHRTTRPGRYQIQPVDPALPGRANTPGYSVLGVPELRSDFPRHRILLFRRAGLWILKKEERTGEKNPVGKSLRNPGKTSAREADPVSCLRSPKGLLLVAKCPMCEEKGVL